MSFFTNKSPVFDKLANADNDTESNTSRNHSSSSQAHQSGLNGSTTHSIGSYYTSRTATSRRSRGVSVSSSLFNRLANTETYATASMKGKLSNSKTSNDNAEKEKEAAAAFRYHTQEQKPVDSGLWHRLAYTETFSTRQMKGMNDTASLDSHHKPKTSNSFFHRMAYAETFATASKKGLVEEENQTSYSKKVTNNSFFDRMCNTETYASASKKSAYDYGKSPNTPTSRKQKFASPDLFDRLARTDTKASSLKKSSSWQKREDIRAKSAPRPRRSGESSLYKRYTSYTSHYHAPTNSKEQHVSPYPYQNDTSINSVASARSTRSERSNISFRSNIADYVRSNRIEIIKKHQTPPTSTLSKPKPISPSRNRQISIGSLSTLSTTRSLKDRQSLSRTTAADRLRQESTKKQKEKSAKSQKSTKRTTSPMNRSLKTSTTASLSSFTSSKRSVKKVVSSKTVPVPPKPKPAPQPRPLLQFDSDDDFSFGSEEEDDFDLGEKKEEEDDKKKEGGETPTPQDDKSKHAEPVEDPIEVVLDHDGSNVDGADQNDHAESFTYKSNGKSTRSAGSMSVDTLSVGDLLGMGNSDSNLKNEEEHDDSQEENDEEHDTEHGLHVIASQDEEADDEDEDRSDTLPEDDNQQEKDELTDLLDGATLSKETDEVPDFLDDNPAEEIVDENHSEDAGSEQEEEDELDDILDDDNDEPKETKPQQVEKQPNEMEESEEIARVTSDNFSEDDLSMGDDESIGEDEIASTVASSTANADVKKSPELPPEDEHGESAHSMEFNSLRGGEEMRNSSTLDSLDFLLDASSTIAEEPEMEEEGSEEEVSGDHRSVGANKTNENYEEDSLFEDDEYDEDYLEEQSSQHEEPEDGEPAEELPPLKYKLLISDKYHPEYGLEDLYPDDLYLVDSLLAFEEGAISNQELAVLIIEALFERDFENGDHWEIDAGTARDLEPDEGGGGDLAGCAFKVKRQARLDWNDLYSVAAAKGTIIISKEKEEIRVENFSYFVAG